MFNRLSIPNKVLALIIKLMEEELSNKAVSLVVQVYGLVIEKCKALNVIVH